MRKLRIVLVAPTRYDERGVVVYRIGISPNGALGSLAGLIEDYKTRHPECRVDYDFFDEHVREAIVADLLRQWRDAAARAGERLVVMVCGVQTVTYPRARDIALMARREGIDVIAGGVHLSAHGPSVDFLVSCGVPVAIGEVEPIWDDIMEDSFTGSFRSVYRIRNDQGMQVKSADSYMTAPDIAEIPFPHIPSEQRSKYVNPSQLFIDSSRGCPFLCTFCVVKNVFGRSVRDRDPKRLVAWMIERVRDDGVRAFSFTDDNFLRSPRHLEVLEQLAAERSRGTNFNISLILDVESTCYIDDDSPQGKRSRKFLDLCESAGVSHVYLGLESTNDAVLREMRKGVNRDREEIHGAAGSYDAGRARQRLINRYRRAVAGWHSIGASVECGYILGASADSLGSGKQAALDLIEIGVDVASFFLLTALPGSEDYAQAVREGTLSGTDFNEYFTHRPTLVHPTLSPQQLEDELKAGVDRIWAWPTVLRRISSSILGLGRRRIRNPFVYLKRQLGFKVMLMTGLYTYVEGGLFRRKNRAEAIREVIGEEEARRFYLGDVSAPLQTTTRRYGDEGSMKSLPLLQHHDLSDSVSNDAAA